MTILHHLNNSRSQRILWMLEELELPYEVKRYQRDAKTMLAPAALRAVHPLGKSPVLEDDGHIIVESAAIAEYLAEKTGRLGAPSARGDALLYRQFLHYAEGSLMPPLLVKLVLSRVPIMGRLAMARFQPMIDTHLAYVEGELARRPWFAGDAMTAADIMMSFPLEAARARAGLDERYPHALAWLEKVQARPAYRRALEVGGPYAY
ncbi:glutathione S-transferase family protein [Novosphingobium sp. KACC 22771]|uniref:glutathione S-transferase family protein n=1 Tax=Novosphingobium sp. KACC 22771 TaxID=3025670 RepID=UPI00236720E6|nr:glutathione S-transferase [Novosphingobium sp. KACC 22771]WDF72170.1 glutathione S-transferase [Novosphingobium sp. KACC 22771]